MFKHSRKVLSLILAFALIASLALVGMPAIKASAATSIPLNDPGFENIAVGTAPNEWPGWGLCTGATVESTIVHSGNNALELSGKAWGPYQGYNGLTQQTGVTLTAGETLTLTCWVYASEAGQIRMYIKNNNDSTSGDQLTTSNTQSNTWEQLSITYVTEDFNGVSVEFGLNLTEDGTAYADDFAMTQGAATPSPSPSPTATPTPTPANAVLVDSFDTQPLGTNHDLGNGWYDSNWTTPLTVSTIENTVVHPGGSTQAVAVQAPAYGGFYQFGYSVTPGYTYDLSGWVYRTDANTPTNLQVQAQGFTFVEGGTLITDFASQSGTWEQLTVEFTVPADAVSPTVQFGFANNDTPAAPGGGLYPVFYVDDVLLTQTNNAPVGTNYTVTFNNNGDTTTIPPVSVAAGASLGSAMPANPTLAGYVFGGWYTGGADGSGSWFTSSIYVNSDMTVYAQWIPTGSCEFRQQHGL
jgi:uncharacterized repeat protein (TIGR02543 family)